jgi:hypothetical protein
VPMQPLIQVRKQRLSSDNTVDPTAYALLTKERDNLRNLLDAERRRGDSLEAALTTANRGQDELRVLLLRQSEEIERQSEQLGRLLPPPRTAERNEPQAAPEPQPAQPEPAPVRSESQPLRRRKPGPWWRPWQR